MRKIYFTFLIAGIILAFGAPLQAQVQFSINLNLSSQPVWGPVGYDEVQYYYLPDIETYYYVPEHRFYYYENGVWINNTSLPPRYSNYNLYNSYKVVLNEREPWRNHNTYRTRYISYKGRHDQRMIRDSHDSKYFANKDHPQHNSWVEKQKHNNGREKDIRHNDNRVNENNHPVNRVKQENHRDKGPNNHEKQNNNHEKHGNGRNK